MQRFRRIALAALMLFLIVLVLSFILENREPASLVFLGWKSVDMPIAGYIISALLIGMVIGPLLAWFFGRRTGRRS